MKIRKKKIIDRDGAFVEEIDVIGKTYTSTSSGTFNLPHFTETGLKERSYFNWLQPSPLRVKCTGKHKPTRGSQGAAGIDLYNNGNDVIIERGSVSKVSTQTYFEIPKGHVGLLFVRSSIGTKRMISLANGTGILDEDYRGEILAMVQYNGNKEHATIKHGERFAQVVIVPYAQLEIEFVDELSDTIRGDGGFGSTGTK